MTNGFENMPKIGPLDPTGLIPIALTFYTVVIARGAKRAVAIQLDCFVVPQGGTPRNDSVFSSGDWYESIGRETADLRVIRDLTRGDSSQRERKSPLGEGCPTGRGVSGTPGA